MTKLNDFTNESVKQGRWSYSLKTKQRLWSPTWILRPFNNLTLGKIPISILEASRERGKDIATAIEILEKHNEVMLDNDENLPMFNAYKKWKKDNDIKIIETEYYVVDHKKNTHGYIDVIAKYKGKIIAVEIKTRAKLKVRDTDLIQNKIYSRAIPKIPFYILMITPDGQYKFEPMLFTKQTELQVDTLINFRKMLGNTKVEGDE